MRFAILILLSLTLSGPAFAVGEAPSGGGGSSTGGGNSGGAAGGGGDGEAARPAGQGTNSSCPDGQFFDWSSGACKPAVQGSLDDDTLYRSARELAEAGRHEGALMLIATMSDTARRSDRVLTDLGYNHRKLGDVALGLSYYRQALDQNPDNIQARSYLGQHYAETGDLALARAELSEIRQRGGRLSWAEVSLRLAIDGARDSY